jgi:putative Holliday junction resolvase
MRALAVDFGGKRIGIAVGEVEHGVASSRPNLEASGTLAKDAMAIRAIAQKEQADLVVIGLAMDADGETKMSRICRKLGDAVAALGTRVEYVDESFTSAEAERSMADAGLKGSERRAKSDGEAACRILERFFEGQV